MTSLPTFPKRRWMVIYISPTGQKRVRSFEHYKVAAEFSLIYKSIIVDRWRQQ